MSWWLNVLNTCTFMYTVFLLWKLPTPPVKVPPCCSSSPWGHWSPLVLSLYLKFHTHNRLITNFIIFLFNPRVRNDYCSFTCANEHDIVLSISSIDSVHSDLCKAVVHIGPDEDGPSAHRVDRVVHQRVVTRELNHIIWETLCWLKAAECLAGALKKGRKNRISILGT